jgi:hypothetical protein
MTALAYHFHGKTLRDGRPLPLLGKWLRHDGEVKLCESGLHASVRLLDALQYAPGLHVDLVRLGWVRKTGEDKIAASGRMRLRTGVFPAARFAAEAACLALWCAGLGQEPWAWALADAAASGDNARIEDAAWAAGAAARAAGDAGAASRAAAWAASWAASGDARAAGAAWAAARDAAWAAGAAGAAARDAAWAAARAARAAGAAWAAARDAAWAALEARAVEMTFGPTEPP